MAEAIPASLWTKRPPLRPISPWRVQGENRGRGSRNISISLGHSLVPSRDTINRSTKVAFFYSRHQAFVAEGDSW